jgi:hypothetical protein
MKSPADFVQPPRIAVWLVNLFTFSEEAESIPGDLLEEFSQLASKSGASVARGWYWRQTAKTVAHLAAAGFRVAPVSTTAVIVGGFLLRHFVSLLPERVIFAVLQRYPDGIAMGHVIASMFVGCVVAWLAKGREMVATMTLGLVLCAMTVASVFLLAARGNDVTTWVWLPWETADWLAIVVGGVIVRTLRPTAPTRHRTT